MKLKNESVEKQTWVYYREGNCSESINEREMKQSIRTLAASESPKQLLITSNFSFSHNVFYPTRIWYLFFHFKCTLKCGSAICFNLFSQCILSYMVLIFRFKCTLKCRSKICFNLDQSTILSPGNGLNKSNKSGIVMMKSN